MISRLPGHISNSLFATKAPSAQRTRTVCLDPFTLTPTTADALATPGMCTKTGMRKIHHLGRNKHSDLQFVKKISVEPKKIVFWKTRPIHVSVVDIYIYIISYADHIWFVQE